MVHRAPTLLGWILLLGLARSVAGQPPPVEEWRKLIDSRDPGALASVLEAVRDRVRADAATLEEALLGSEAALELGAWNDARSLADLGASLAPDDPRPHMFAGHALYRMAEQDMMSRAPGSGTFVRATLADAALAYRRARERGGDAYSLAFFEADAHFLAEAYELALEPIDAALAANPDSSTACFLKGRILMALERPEEAYEALRRSRDLAPADRDVAHALLAAAIGSKDRERARDVFLELVRDFYEDDELYRPFYDRFVADIDLGFLRKTLETALEQNGIEKDRYSVWYLGLLAELEGRLEDALAHFEAYRARRPTTPDGDLKIGSILTRLGRLEGAREALLRANALGGIEPEQLTFQLQQLVGAFVQQQDYERAAALQRVVVSLITDVNAQRDLGVLELGAGRPDEALRIYRSIAAREDLGSEVRATIENYLGLALLGTGKPVEAEAAFRRSLEADPEASLDARENLGVMLVDHERPREGAGHLEDVLRRDPKRDRSRYHLMRARFPDLVEARAQ